MAIPLTMEINDLPHAMRFGRSPSQFVALTSSGSNEPVVNLLVLIGLVLGGIGVGMIWSAIRGRRS